MTTDLLNETERFLRGGELRFAEADELWRKLKSSDRIALARKVLDHLHEPHSLMDTIPAAQRLGLARQRAMLTSKDQELGASVRHDLALEILGELVDLSDSALDGQVELLGIAGGIHKRRWQDLGQLLDLQAAAAYYTRAAGANLGTDAYAHINAAFLDDLLAEVNDDAELRRERARALRLRIVDELPASAEWFNTASRAEALFGLRRFDEATAVLKSTTARPDLWELQTTARQLGDLAALCKPSSEELPKVRAFFDALWPGGADAAFSMCIGKVGLALSGGGFRASFYHLGVLARLAEHDMLRHVDVLSCVSGGSIVGTSYWLALRTRLLDPRPMQREDYVALVKQVIDQFSGAVEGNLRGEVQPGKLKAAFRLLSGEAKGLLDPEEVAEVLDERFYRPLMPGHGEHPILMHELAFVPADHPRLLPGAGAFNPRLHNWLRAHKVPALVLNATCVNTGHAWQFTTTWMGESPWAIHDEVDSVSRLEWSEYAPEAGWQIELGRAVAASACVPGIFDPLRLAGHYGDGVQVQLLDGGVFDNQGTVSLLAMNCNVLIVSDACGQLMLEKAPAAGLSGLGGYAKRAMDVLMERIRGANHADLSARKLSGQMRRLMFLHMKAGLDADVVPRLASQETQSLRRSVFSPSGVRREFQTALAEIRTDLDIFNSKERDALMACGYQMAGHAIDRDLADQRQLVALRQAVDWSFKSTLDEMISTAQDTPDRKPLLGALKNGARIRI